MIRYYSQSGEDKEIIARYFSETRNGVFVELGALDGYKFSNTKTLEDEYGWTGVLIEPHPIAFHRLQWIRPNAKLYNCAVGVSKGRIQLIVNPDEPAVSTVVGATPRSFTNTWHRQSIVVDVECRTLADILHDAGIMRVDFLSLDVEGYEFEVLLSMDWSIPIRVILIEMISDHPEKNMKCRALLRQHGYRFDGTCAHNEIWVLPSS